MLAAKRRKSSPASVANRHRAYRRAEASIRRPGNFCAFLRLTLLCLLALFAPLFSRADDLEAIFKNPPDSARPWVFWYWMNGAVSREGITADVAAMKQAGIGGAYLMTINAPANPPVYTPVATPMTPEWWALVRHAATEADRLGVKLAFADSDGFATAGGPWITPELSMQKVVWSETHVDGGKSLSAPLAQPPINENYYRDIAVIAFPTPEGSDVTATPKITTSLPDFDAQFLAAPDLKKQLRTDVPTWIMYEYAAPFTLRSLVIRQWDHNYNGVYHATRMSLETSDDGKEFHPLTRLEPPRHGWQDWDADYTFSVPPTTARFFRFKYDPAGAETGSEDLDGAKWKARLLLRGLELSSAPRLPGFEGKSGAVWRQTARATDAQLPATQCVPRAQIVDLTAKLSTDGRLDWTPPAGRWTILRVGHTSTGHRNETATSTKGLECDKLNPAAVRAQFDGWFGEVLRQLGEPLASRVVKIFHVDSWETGSQNWSPIFRAEFTKRRGYDLTPWLPVFAGIPVGSAAESEKFLADVRLTVSDLLTENFFGVFAALARAHGCEFSAESTAPTMSGDGMRHFGQVDLPMGEFWLRSPTHDKPNDIADAISGARAYGKNIVQAEAFTELRESWDEHPGLLKPLADHEFALGINRFVLHVFAHNPWLDRRPGMTLSGVGTYFQRDQTWWPDASAWMDYVARCSALLQVGHPVADIAYFTGEELPVRAVLPERRTVPLPEGYTADSINRDALLRLATVRDGRLVLPGGASYAALVLPPDKGPRSAELTAKLREFGSIAVDSSDALRAQLTRAKAESDLLAFAVGGKAISGIEWIHRQAADADTYFVSNQESSPREVQVSIRGIGRTVEVWNPATTEREPAVFSPADGRSLVGLNLEANGSRFVILRAHANQPARIEEHVEPVATKTFGEAWNVAFDPKNGGPAEPVAFATLSDWSKSNDERVRFYSGTATYTTHFDAHVGATRTWVDLGRVENLAHVFVNGTDCGVAWTSPYRVDVTRALRTGDNTLEVHVTNTWLNRRIGDRGSKTPLTWTIAAIPDNARLLPAGLLGPVQLLEQR